MITVLLIDDDDEFILLSEALYRLDKLLNCVYADSAESAIEILRNFSPHYIFIDLNMPKTTGLECIVQIRRLKNMQKRHLLFIRLISAKDYGKKQKRTVPTATLKKREALPYSSLIWFHSLYI